MSLISPLFLFVCLPAALAIYSFVPKAAKKSAIAVICTVFYLIANIKNPFALLLMLATVIAVYAFSRLIDRQRGRKRVMCAHFLALVFLLSFLVLRFADPLGINPLCIEYPFGASVWLLCAISCIFDVERGDAPPPSLIDAVTYVAYFPLMAAGPIVKYRKSIGMFSNINFSLSRAARGAEYFMLGFVKRFAVASVLFSFIETISINVENGIGIVAIIEFCVILPIAVYAYFSGYSDMGVGVSLMFGIMPPENFNKPLTALSPIDYTKRFMSSLYDFAADYIGYIRPHEHAGRARRFFAKASVFFFVIFWFESDPFKLLALLPISLLLAAFSERKRGNLPRFLKTLCICGTFVCTALFWGFLMLEDIGDFIPLATSVALDFRLSGSLFIYGASMPKYLLSAIVTSLIVIVFDRVVRGDLPKLSNRALAITRMSVNFALVGMLAFTLFFYFPQFV